MARCWFGLSGNGGRGKSRSTPNRSPRRDLVFPVSVQAALVSGERAPRSPVRRSGVPSKLEALPAQLDGSVGGTQVSNDAVTKGQQSPACARPALPW
jgi:hypothetical protein